MGRKRTCDYKGEKERAHETEAQYAYIQKAFATRRSVD